MRSLSIFDRIRSKLCTNPNYGSGTLCGIRLSLHANEAWGHTKRQATIGRASLARENEAGGSWGQEVHILHVNI